MRFPRLRLPQKILLTGIRVKVFGQDRLVEGEFRERVWFACHATTTMGFEWVWEGGGSCWAGEKSGGMSLLLLLERVRILGSTRMLLEQVKRVDANTWNASDKRNSKDTDSMIWII